MNNWEKDHKIYLNQKKREIIEKYEENKKIFDEFGKEYNPNIIDNYTEPMYNYLEEIYKDNNPDKDEIYIIQIFKYLKEKYKSCNPNLLHKDIDKMYDFLEKNEYCLDHFINREESYIILEKFMNKQK